jgi:hypothetical protein
LRQFIVAQDDGKWDAISLGGLELVLQLRLDLVEKFGLVERDSISRAEIAL